MSWSSNSDDFERPAFEREDLGLTALPEPPANDTEAAIIRIFCKNLGIGNLGAQDSFFLLGGDSLRAATLLFDILYDLGVSLPPSALVDSPTPRALAKLVANGVTPDVAAVIAEPGRRTSIRRPLIFFHGDYTEMGFFMRTLSDVLGEEELILPIAPRADGARCSIEEMAAERLPEILSAQPSGPYRLGGHCNGALVAFEAARLLAERGEQVEFLVLVDPVVVNARSLPRVVISLLAGTLALANTSVERRDALLRRTWSWFARRDHRRRRRTNRRRALYAKFRAKSWTARATALGRAAARGSALAVEAGPRAKDVRPEQSNIELLHRTALATYFPAPLNVPVLYFALRYSGRGWSRISPNTEMIDIFSGHHRLSPEALASLRRELLSRMHIETAGKGVNEPGASGQGIAF